MSEDEPTGKLSAAANRIMDRMCEFMALKWQISDRRGSSYQPTRISTCGLILELCVHDPASSDPSDRYRFPISLLTPWGRKTFAATTSEDLQSVYLIDRFKRPLGLELRHDVPCVSGWCYYNITNPEGIYDLPPIKRESVFA